MGDSLSNYRLDNFDLIILFCNGSYHYCNLCVIILSMDLERMINSIRKEDNDVFRAQDWCCCF